MNHLRSQRQTAAGTTPQTQDSFPQPAESIRAPSMHRVLTKDDENFWDTFQQPTIKKHPKSPRHNQTAVVPLDDDRTDETGSDTDKAAPTDDDQSVQTRVPSTGGQTPSGLTSGQQQHTAAATSSKQCHSLTCRTVQIVTNPYIFVTLGLVLLYLYVRRRSRRLPSQGHYRAVAAQYTASAFNEELSRDDYLSDDDDEEQEEFWTQGKKSIEMGTYKDDLTLDEVNG